MVTNSIDKYSKKYKNAYYSKRMNVYILVTYTVYTYRRLFD